MKIRPKLVITFSVIFVISFAASSFVAHTTMVSSLTNSGVSDEQVDSILGETRNSITAASVIIGAVAILVVFGVSTRIANPISVLSKKLRAQRIGERLRNIEIKRSAIDKDDEINEVTHTINLMINRLNKLELKKEELLAIIAHELKTPLSTMLGFAQMLDMQMIKGTLNPTQQKSIKIINRNVSDLKKMIVDLLDSQKIDLEKMRFENTHVDVNKLMEEFGSHFENLLQEKQIQFVTSTKEKISLTTDRTRLQQVFEHLILNAIDFVPNEGGKIEIASQTKDDDIIFYVKDNGIGISSERQKDIFKKEFNKSITRTHGGTGLGLSICKGIINGLEGKIWVESEKGKGTTFFFTIPKKL